VLGATGGDHRLPGTDPVARSEAHHQTRIEPAHDARVEVFQASARKLKASLFEQSLDAARVAPAQVPSEMPFNFRRNTHSTHRTAVYGAVRTVV